MAVGATMRLSAISLLLLAVVASAAARKSYRGYQVIDAFPQTKAQLDFLREVSMTDTNLDFWEDPRQVGQKVRFLVEGSYLERMTFPALAERGIAYEVAVQDVQAHIDEVTPQLAVPEPRAFDLDDFNYLVDINQWLSDQANNCPVGLTCSLYSIGQSYHGMDQWMFKVSAGEGRMAYYLDSTTHAREWLSTATNLKILNNFLTNYNDPEVAGMLAFDWYFLIVMNPDGYQYSWLEDRYWRKNRNDSLPCVGVDLNRNFDFRWCLEGASPDSCSTTYCGSSGASEKETQNVQAEIMRLAPSLKAMVTVHTYGEYWLYPWGNTVDYAGAVCDLPDDNADLMAVTTAACDAIEATFPGGREWRCGNSCATIYETTGATDDWSKGVAGVKYSFNPELRGNDFVVAPSEIQPSFEEFWNGLVAMVNAIG